MGARRDDILCPQRLQIARTMLAPDRPAGTVTHLAHTFGVSRQTMYRIAAQAERVVLTGLAPGPHGPSLPPATIPVDRDSLRRASVVLTEVGVSQRDVAFCLAEVFDSAVSVGWLHAVLDQVEQAAAAQNAAWQPNCGETLAGDELFSNGSPNPIVANLSEEA
jgi:transposase-like protein